MALPDLADDLGPGNAATATDICIGPRHSGASKEAAASLPTAIGYMACPVGDLCMDGRQLCASVVDGGSAWCSQRRCRGVSAGCSTGTLGALAKPSHPVFSSQGRSIDNWGGLPRLLVGRSDHPKEMEEPPTRWVGGALGLNGVARPPPYMRTSQRKVRNSVRSGPPEKTRTGRQGRGGSRICRSA